MDTIVESEIWKPVETFNGQYSVSNTGKIRNQLSGKILKPTLNTRSGYFSIRAEHCGIKKKIYIHKAVANAFIENPCGLPYVRHINGDKSDNQVSNLEWHAKPLPKRKNVDMNRKWTDESCTEAAKLCSSATEFKNKYRGAYKHAHKTDLWKSFTWLTGGSGHGKPKSHNSQRPRKWTDESCTEAAKLCSSATEFKERFPGGYRYAHKTDLWKSFTWFRHSTNPNSRTYVVYAYEDTVNNAVYVGLTNNLARREMEHRKKNYKNDLRKYDIVRQYFEDVGLPMPKPTVLRDGMDGFEAQAAEDEFKGRYASDGWNLINTGKTGFGVSSLGNLAYRRPDRDECAEIVKGCNSRKELKRKSWIAYTTIVMNEWEDLLPPKWPGNPSRVDWAARMSEYRDRSDLMSKNNKLYKEWRKRGLLDKYMPSEYSDMDDSRIVEAAREYKDRRSLKDGKAELYYICKHRSLLDTAFPIQPKRKRQECSASFEECSEIASGYKNRCDLKKGRPDIFKRMKGMGWLDQIFPPRRRSYRWTEKSALEFGSGCENREELREKSHSCYRFLRDHGLLGKVFPKKVVRSRYLFDAPFSDCVERAELCSCWSQYRHKYTKYANLCVRNGWDDGIKAAFANRRRKIVDDQRKKCHDSAMSCSTKSEFRVKYPSEYRLASKHKWLKEYTWLKGCKGG